MKILFSDGSRSWAEEGGGAVFVAYPVAFFPSAILSFFFLTNNVSLSLDPPLSYQLRFTKFRLLYCCVLVIINRRKIGEGSEVFGRVTMNLPAPSPPPPTHTRLCSILMILFIVSQFSKVPHSYSVRDDWDPLHPPDNHLPPPSLPPQKIPQPPMKQDGQPLLVRFGVLSSMHFNPHHYFNK